MSKNRYILFESLKKGGPMVLSNGKIFDRADANIVINHLKKVQANILEVDPRHVKLVKSSRDALKLQIITEIKSFYTIRKSLLYKLLKWFNISYHNIVHFSIDTIIAICNDNLRSIANNDYHPFLKIKIEEAEAVSILSSKFTIISDLEVIDLCKKYNIDTISRDDFSMRIYTTIKEKSEPIVGDTFGYGYNIINSETGFSSLKAENYILRYWCTNGATTKIINDKHSFNHYKLNKKHGIKMITETLDNSKPIQPMMDKKIKAALQKKPNLFSQIYNIESVA